MAVSSQSPQALVILAALDLNSKGVTKLVITLEVNECVKVEVRRNIDRIELEGIAAGMESLTEVYQLTEAKAPAPANYG